MMRPLRLSVRALLPRWHITAGQAFVVLALAATGAAQAQTPTDPYTYSRSSSFTYQSNGLLQSETIEPDNVASCVATTYEYDANGNKNKATTANCAGASGRAVFAARAASSAYAAVPSQPIKVAGATVNVAIPAGLVATSATNALNQSESRTYDPRFGAMLTLTGPNTLTTTIEVDDFGRKIKETRADGTSTVVYHCVILGKGLNTSSNSAGCGSTVALSAWAGEIPGDAVSYVHTEARDTTGTKMGPAARVYSDRAGRKLREVAEAFDAASQPSARRHVGKDTSYNAQGVVTLTSQPYFLGTGSSTVTGNGDLGMTVTAYDALGRPIQVDVTDPQGNVPGVYFGGSGPHTSARTLISYSGLVTTTTNPKGQTRTEEKNVDGKLVRVSDAYGGQIAYQHDAFGNLVQTKDALQNLVRLSYDIRGRKLAMTDPDTGLWQYDYNALGELVWQQNANQLSAGTATTLAYDLLGRMTSRTEPEYTSTWVFDKYADGSACSKGIGKLCESKTSHGINKKTAYDSLGRPSSSRTTVTSGPSFATKLTYQSSTGRVDTQAFPTGMTVSYSYTALGFVDQLKTSTPATITPLPATRGGAAGASASLPANSVLWAAGTMSAWGKAETQTLGNVTSRAGYDPATGRIASASAGVGNATNVLSHSYSWDSLNNLSARSDANGDGNTGAVSETFLYDSLNRLSQYTVAAPLIPNLARTVNLNYNAIGNILYKSDVGNYDYAAYGNNAGVSNPRPHAVASVAGTSYIHDANGNLTATTGGKYRSLSYTSFNLPDSNSGAAGAGGSPRYTWQYDENHQRIRETHVDASGTRTTWYQHPDNQGGLGFESETAPSGAISNRHYLSAGSQTIVLVSTGALPTLASGTTTPPTIASITLVKLEYWHKDHLGSLAATTDHVGNPTARYAYDPFGKRRMTSGQYDEFGTLVVDWASDVNYGTDRGFTGHEQLDDIGVVHMNGRLYDPLIGRFAQGDPFVQDSTNLQNFDRYGYCGNSPTGCTDPSGYFFKWVARKWREEIWRTTYGRVAIAVVVSIVSYGYGSEWAAQWLASTQTAATTGFSAAAINATAAVGGGFAAGFSASLVMSDGDFNTALRGGVAGALMGGVTSGLSDASLAARATAKAGTSAAIARSQGGDWRRAARFALMTEMGREAWAYTARETDRLYASACEKAENCRYDEFGAQTDGGRSVYRGISSAEYQRVPGLLRSYLGGGMEMEGSGAHLYDTEGSLCDFNSTLCAGVRQFVRQVSKPHDWGNSWSYDRTGSTGFLGWRVEGGGYDSLWARVGYEVGVQTWSFVTMPVMATFTGFSLYGNYVNPGFRSSEFRP